MGFQSILIKAAISTLPLLVLLVFPLKACSYLSLQPQIVTQAPRRAETNSPLQFIGTGEPQIQLLQGVPHTEGLSRMLQGAKWLFYPDGTFVFVPSENANVRNDLYPITGTYRKVGDVFEFQAERRSSVVDASASVDGVIRVDKDRVLLEATRASIAGISRQIARISQTLSPASQVTAEPPQQIQGIEVPSFFKVSLRGKTEAQVFDSIPATLKILSHTTDDSNPFFVILKTEIDDANGSLLWSSFAPIQAGQQEFSSKITINGNQVRLDVNPSQEQFRLDVSWTTLPTGTIGELVGGAIPVGVAVKRGTMIFSIEGDSISGKVQAEGISDLGNPSRYEAEFTGQRTTEGITFPSPKQLQVKQPIGLEKQVNESNLPFNGTWTVDEPCEKPESCEELEPFEKLELNQRGQEVNGTYSGRGGGTIEGTVQGNRLDFTWKDSTGKGWGFLRVLADETTLIGMWGIGTDKTEGQNLFATKTSQTVSSTAASSQDMRSLRDEGYDLVLQGKCQQAITPLTNALDLFEQESNNQEISNLMQVSALIDVLNIQTRLSSCYFLFQNYEELVLSLNKVIETRRRLNQTDYLQSVNRDQANLIQNGIADYAELWRQRLNSDVERIAALENAQSFLQNLMSLFVESGNEEEALLVAEKSKARAFADLLAERLSSNIFEANATPPTIQQIQQIARTQNATLVEYVIIREANNLATELLIWVIQPTGEVKFESVDITWQKSDSLSFEDLIDVNFNIILAQLIEVSSGVVNNSDPSPYLKELYQKLIEPIAEFLPEDPNAHVIFIPHRELFSVPFPALLNASEEFLIQKHTILTAPSIQVLDSTNLLGQQNQGVLEDVLVVANPAFAPELDSLEDLQDVANEIAEQFNTTAITGKQATEETILNLMPRARIIHLATHARFEDNGLESWIALAPSKDDDGRLTAGEIFEFYASQKRKPLRAELIFLAACQTGGGKPTADGVVGLSRSLIAAGIPSAVVTLWSVLLEPTNSITKKFYDNLSLGKAQALRKAMLETKDEFPNQIGAWAGFTLIGEAE